MTAVQRRLVEGNLRIAGCAARRFYRGGEMREEAEAAALFGLVRAAIGYRDMPGRRFEPYAAACCRNEIRRGRADLVRRRRDLTPRDLPRGATEAELVDLRDFVDWLLTRLPARVATAARMTWMEERTAEEVRLALGCSLRTVDRMLAQARRVLRYEAGRSLAGRPTGWRMNTPRPLTGEAGA